MKKGETPTQTADIFTSKDVSCVKKKYLSKAYEYIFLQDLELAARRLDRLCALYEDDVEILFKRIEVAQKQNNVDDLLVRIKELKKKTDQMDSMGFALLFAKIKIYRNKKDEPHSYENAMALQGLKEELLGSISLLKTDHSEHFATWYILGCAFEAFDDIEEAIKCWKTALQINPESISVISALAFCKGAEKVQSFEGNEFFRETLEAMDPYLVYGNIETHIKLYEKALQSKNYAHALCAINTMKIELQKQLGEEVSPEALAFCALSAMSIYQIEEKHAQARICYEELEKILAHCPQNQEGLETLANMAFIFSEYGLHSMSQRCSLSVLTAKYAPIDLIIKIATHCISKPVSEEIRASLSVAYQRFPNQPKLRFCLLICGLKISGIDVREYIANKKEVLQMIQEKLFNAKLMNLLEKLYQDYGADPEIYQYLAETYWKQGDLETAKEYFETLLQVDKHYTEGAFSYGYFLLECQMFERAHEVSEHLLTAKSLTDDEKLKANWIAASSLCSMGQYEKSHKIINELLEKKPWNLAYLCLSLKICNYRQGDLFLQTRVDIVKNLEKLVKNPTDLELKKRLWVKITDYSYEAGRLGFEEFIWNMTKTLFLCCKNEIDGTLLRQLSRAGSNYNLKKSVQQLLLLFSDSETKSICSFIHIACCVAQIYALSQEWNLANEWLSIAKKSNALEETKMELLLFEIEELILALQSRVIDFEKPYMPC